MSSLYTCLLLGTSRENKKHLKSNYKLQKMFKKNDTFFVSKEKSEIWLETLTKMSKNKK